MRSKEYEVFYEREDGAKRSVLVLAPGPNSAAAHVRLTRQAKRIDKVQPIFKHREQ